MRLLARVQALERTYGRVDMSPEGQRARHFELIKRDGEAMDMVVRIVRVLDNQYRGASPAEQQRLKREDPYLRSLQERFDARSAEIQAGAPLKPDQWERHRRMFNRLPPPDWNGEWLEGGS